jgi:hypothetical protein
MQGYLWHSIIGYCQWIVAFGLATSLYLRTDSVAKLNLYQVVLGTEKHIVSLIGRRTVHVSNIFDKTHKLSLQNTTAQRDIRKRKYDAVEDINNPHFFVKAIHHLRYNCSPLHKRVFTLKNSNQEMKNLHEQGLKLFYFDALSSREIDMKSIHYFLDELSDRYGFKNPGDGKPTFYRSNQFIPFLMNSVTGVALKTPEMGNQHFIDVVVLASLAWNQMVSLPVIPWELPRTKVWKCIPSKLRQTRPQENDTSKPNSPLVDY